MSSLNRAFAYFMGASFIGSATQVAKGKLTAIFLGAEGVGVLNQLTNVWSLCSLLAGMGFYNGMVRHLAQSWGEGDYHSFRKHFSSSAVFLLFSSLCVAFIACLFSDLLSGWVFGDEGARGELICIIMLGIPVFTAAQVYRAMLNATRSISGLVRARIAADVLSILVLAVLVWPFGLKGAVASYVGLHVLSLIFFMFYANRILGKDVTSLRGAVFSWTEIQRNIGYGVNGLVAVAVGLMTSLIVSRWIISDLSVHDNGIYAMALKVATVYLGGLAAAGGGYFFPTLSMSRDDTELHGHVTTTLIQYMYVIPPIIALLMIGGEMMMSLFFSSEFIPAAVLLLFLLPGDLIRVSAETVGMPLVVKRKLVLSTGLYMTWAASYLLLAALFLHNYGLLGVAVAYLISQLINAAFVFFAVSIGLGYRLPLPAVVVMVRGAVLVGAVAVSQYLIESKFGKYTLSAFVLCLWMVVSMREAGFVELVRKIAGKFRRGV